MAKTEKINPASHWVDQHGYVQERKPMHMRKTKPRTLKQLRKRSTEKLCRCPGCGAEKVVKGFTWCDCDPAAPFRMVPVSVSEQIGKLNLKLA
jgi:hypothetical protein